MKKTRSALRVVIFLTTALMTISFTEFTHTHAYDEYAFGSMFRYNTIVLGDFIGLEAGAEGALAVGGNAHFGSPGKDFTVASSASPSEILHQSTVGNPLSGTDTLPVLVVGGIPSLTGGGCAVYGGRAALASAHKDTYGAGDSFNATSGVSFYSDQDLTPFFAYVENKSARASAALNASPSPALSPDELSRLNQEDLDQFSSHGLNLSTALVINVESQRNTQLHTVDLPASITAYDLIVINVPGENIRFSEGEMRKDGVSLELIHGNEDLSELASRILWNFPNASSLTIQDYDLIGSVLAPKATVLGQGGSINGQLICRSFTQSGGTELHNFSLLEPERLLNLAPPSTRNLSAPEQPEATNQSSPPQSSIEESTISDQKNDPFFEVSEQESESSPGEDDVEEIEMTDSTEPLSPDIPADASTGQDPIAGTKKDNADVDALSPASTQPPEGTSTVVGDQDRPDTGIPPRMAPAALTGLIAISTGVVLKKGRRES